MRFPRALPLLLALILTACPGSSPVDPLVPLADAGDSSLTFTTEELPAATVSQPYRVTLAASGGSPAYSWHLFQGALPAGLALSESGEITGTPSARGATTFTVEVRDSAGQFARRMLGIDVLGAGLEVATLSLPDAYLGSEYTPLLSASGGTPPYVWVLTSGALPLVVRLGADGRFAGMPVGSGSFAVTLSVQDASGLSAQRDFTLSVFAPPSLSTTALDPGFVGTPYSVSLTASGGRAPLSFRIASGALPEGLRLEGGSVLGTPTAPGTASFTVEVQDVNGRAASSALQLTVHGGLTITPTTLPDAYTDSAYGHGLSAVGGQPPYTWTLTQSSLPAGLRLLSSGALDGTASTAGTTTFTVRVTDTVGDTDTRAVSLTTYTPPSLAAVPAQNAYVGDNVSLTLSASGGKAPYAFTSSGVLPSWLTLTEQGLLQGKAPQAGVFTFNVSVRDSNGRTASRSVSVAVHTPPSIDTPSLPEAVRGQPYSATLTASHGRAPLSWSHTGSLPAGLSLASSGVISGTPTATGSVSFTVFVQDAGGLEDSRALTLTVRSASALLNVGHWNLEWFGAPNQGPPNSSSDGGTSDDLQIAHARDIIGDAGVDVWGLVEMVDSADFATLKAQLPGYSGFLANDVSFVPGGSSWYGAGEQKPGILYDSTLTFRGAQLILTPYAADFGGRPPLRVDFTTRVNGEDMALTVIVVHMKAFEDDVSYGQRQRSSAALKNYLDLRPSERVLVVGDWNDDIDRSISSGNDGTYLASPFEPFVLDSARYTFITRPLSLAGERTTVSYREAIDHTLVTNEMAVHYLSNTVRVLRPDSWIPNYGNVVSDHYPVVSRYDLAGDGGSEPSAPPVLFINELLANEPSLDGGVGDPHFEFIEVLNAGTSSADLSGWSLWDSTVARHVFPSGTSLAAGQAFVVYGGPRGFPVGKPNTLAASTGQLGLNNDGDTARLFAPDGGIVDSVSYTTTIDNVSINRMPDAVPDAGFVPHTTLNPGLGSSAGRRADGGTF